MCSTKNKIFPTSTAHPASGRVVRGIWVPGPATGHAAYVTAAMGQRGPCLYSGPACHPGFSWDAGRSPAPTGTSALSPEACGGGAVPTMATGWSQHSTSALRLGAEKGRVPQPLLSGSLSRPLHPLLGCLLPVLCSLAPGPPLLFASGPQKASR